MDWNQHMEEMVNSWTDMQRLTWETWMTSIMRLNGAIPGSPADQALGQEDPRSLDAWEASVKKALEAQYALARNWSSRVNPENTPDAVSLWNDQWQQMMQGWTDTQEKLWAAWFESMRSIHTPRASRQWGEENQEALEAWQQAHERAQTILAEWARRVRDSQAARAAAHSDRVTA